MSGKGSHVSDVLAEVFKRGGMKRAVKRAESVLLWTQVVGPEVAKFTEAKTLRDGLLYVETSDSETAMHLMLQRQRFLDVYRAKFGVKDIQDIRFSVGRPRSMPIIPDDPKPQVQINAKELAKLAKDLGELDLPEILAAPTMQAAKAMLTYRERKRAEGWQECRICGSLTPTPESCDSCKRYALEPRVKTASQALILDPTIETPLLSDEERLVAKHQAQSYLKDKLQEILPYVLADPSRKLELESVARCYVAHCLNKQLAEVSEADLDILDSRVARVLGRWK